MKPDPTQIDFRQLVDHYDHLASQHGYAPEAVHWSDWETAERRFEILLQGFPDFKNARIMDFGCGAGHLLRYLKKRGFSGEYTGYDIAPEMIRLAKSSNPDGHFELRNLLEIPPEDQFDIALVSGVFNNRITENERFLYSTLGILHNSVSTGVAFNAMSRYVHFRNEDLHYYCPLKVFDFCKSHLSPNVTLRHDYQIKPGVIPYEFTIYIYKSDLNPVPALA